MGWWYSTFNLISNFNRISKSFTSSYARKHILLFATFYPQTPHRVLMYTFSLYFHRKYLDEFHSLLPLFQTFTVKNTLCYFHGVESVSYPPYSKCKKNIPFILLFPRNFWEQILPGYFPEPNNQFKPQVKCQSLYIFLSLISSFSLSYITLPIHHNYLTLYLECLSRLVIGVLQY